MKIKPPPLLFLGILIISTPFTAIYTFSYVQYVLPGVRVAASSTVSSQGLTLSFSSDKPSYKAGERAIFYIDVLNLRDNMIRRIDFSLKVKALSLLGFQALEIEDYSTRNFNPGRPERIVVERNIPMIAPPGFFTLNLEAKPASLKPLPTATITIHIEPSTISFIAHLTVSILSGVAFCSSIFMAHTSVEALRTPLPKRRVRINSQFGKFTFSAGVELPVLRDPKVRELGILMFLIDAKIRGTIGAFSIGQKFVFSGIWILMATALTFSAGLEQVAEQLAILAYFTLVIGVGNLMWENLKVKHLSELKSPALRSILSLLTFNGLIYLSALPTELTATSTFASLILIAYVIARLAKGQGPAT
ncbi:MAG: hypothetical protein ACUVTM_08160 [Candidatus Bathyarchaeia archaeon]